MIKYILLTIVILKIMNVNSQENTRKWSQFRGVDKINFSISFMMEMSKQLKQKFENELDCTTCVDEVGFSLLVGEVDSTVIRENDIMKIKVEIHNSYDRKWILTTKWSSKEFSDPNEIHKSDITGKKVEFYWDNDFPKDDFLRIINSRILIPKTDKKLKFDLEIYNDVYPPEVCQFLFLTPPTKKEFKAVNDFFRNYQSSHLYFLYTELTDYLDDPRYLMNITLQIPEWNKEKFEIEIQEIFQLLSDSIKNNNISKIILCH